MQCGMQDAWLIGGGALGRSCMKADAEALSQQLHTKLPSQGSLSVPSHRSQVLTSFHLHGTCDATCATC